MEQVVHLRSTSSEPANDGENVHEIDWPGKVGCTVVFDQHLSSSLTSELFSVAIAVGELNDSNRSFFNLCRSLLLDILGHRVETDNGSKGGMEGKSVQNLPHLKNLEYLASYFITRADTILEFSKKQQEQVDQSVS